MVKSASDDRNNGSNTAERNPNGTFALGNRGKPKGARHKATKAVEDLLEGQAEGITQKAIELALAGDTTALRLCIERIIPPRKDTPVNFYLPSMHSSSDAVKGAASILDAVSNGDLTPLEATSVMALVERYRRALETSELEDRISALEEGTKS